MELEGNQNSPKLLELTAAVIQQLPSIIIDKGADDAEIWGVDLRGSGDEQKIIDIVKRFLSKHSAILPFQYDRTCIAISRTLEWRRVVNPRLLMAEAKSVLFNLDFDFFYITPFESQCVMWTIFDEQAFKSLRLLQEGLISAWDLNKLGIGVMEHLMSTMLNRSLPGDDCHTAVQVIDCRPFAPTDARENKREGGSRQAIRDTIEMLIPLFRDHYPQTLRTIYLICPPKELLAPLRIPDNIVEKCVLLDDRKHLATHLGSGIPREFGGTGKSLKDMDCLRDPNVDIKNYDGDTQIVPQQPQHHEQPPAIETEDHIDTKDPDKPLPSEQGIYKRLVSDTGDLRLLYSETIGPPSIVLDPKDVDVAQVLCPQAGERPASAPRLVLMDSDMVVKFGTEVSLEEAEAMHLVQTSTSIPIPKLLSAYIIDATCYIIMSYEKGELLHEYWDKASDAEQSSVISQLRENLKQLHAIEGDFIGGLNRSPCKDQIFCAGWGDYRNYSYGPYNSEAEFNEGIVQALKDRFPPKNIVRPNSSFANYEYSVSRVVRGLKGHRIVFTHADLHSANILVRTDGTVVILDWGGAGFWPEYWEFYRALFTEPRIKTWDREVEKFVPPYPIENLAIEHVFRALLWS